MAAPERPVVSIIKAAALAGVSRRTVYNWMASGKVEYQRTAGGAVRIFVDTLWRGPKDLARKPVNLHLRVLPEPPVD